MSIATELLDVAEVVTSEITDIDALVQQLDEHDQQRQKPECGIAWFFVPARGDLFEASSSLALGVRGDVGALMWFTATHEFVPATGSNVETADYFVTDGHHFDMAPGAELPIEQVRAALREYVQTGQCPTSVEWVPAP